MQDIAMDDYRLLIDLHKQGSRQGTGGDVETEQALNLAMVDRAAPLKGCGYRVWHGGIRRSPCPALECLHHGGGLHSGLPGRAE
jgi:hypothetical protein